MDTSSAVIIDESRIHNHPVDPINESSRSLTVAIISADPVVRAAMVGILKKCGLRAVLVGGLTGLMSMRSREKVVACLCGFCLADGTIREIAAYLKRQPVEIPMIMVSMPAPSREYGDFLDSLSVGAFDFICHPYRVDDIQLILWSAIQSFYHAAPYRFCVLNRSSS